MHVDCLPEKIIKPLRALCASGIWHGMLPGTGRLRVFFVDVGSGIFFVNSSLTEYLF